MTLFDTNDFNVVLCDAVYDTNEFNVVLCDVV